MNLEDVKKFGKQIKQNYEKNMQYAKVGAAVFSDICGSLAGMQIDPKEAGNLYNVLNHLEAIIGGFLSDRENQKKQEEAEKEKAAAADKNKFVKGLKGYADLLTNHIGELEKFIPKELLDKMLMTLLPVNGILGEFGKKGNENASISDILGKADWMSPDNIKADPKGYEKLYDFAQNIFNKSENVNLSGESLQKFTQASKILSAVGPTLMQVNPKKAGQISNDLKLNCLRSKTFREGLIKNGQKMLKSFSEKGLLNLSPEEKNLVKDVTKAVLYGLCSGAFLQSKGKEAIPSKINSKEEGEALLGKYKGIDNLVNKGFTEFLKDPIKYIKMLLNGQLMQQAMQGLASYMQNPNAFKEILATPESVQNQQVKANQSPIQNPIAPGAVPQNLSPKAPGAAPQNINPRLPRDFGKFVKDQNFRQNSINLKQKSIENILKSAKYQDRQGNMLLSDQDKFRLQIEMKTALYGQVTEHLLSKSGINVNSLNPEAMYNLFKATGLENNIDNMIKGFGTNQSQIQNTFLDNKTLDEYAGKIADTYGKDALSALSAQAVRDNNNIAAMHGNFIRAGKEAQDKNIQYNQSEIQTKLASTQYMDKEGNLLMSDDQVNNLRANMKSAAMGKALQQIVEKSGVDPNNIDPAKLQELLKETKFEERMDEQIRNAGTNEKQISETFANNIGLEKFSKDMVSNYGKGMINGLKSLEHQRVNEVRRSNKPKEDILKSSTLRNRKFNESVKDIEKFGNDLTFTKQGDKMVPYGDNQKKLQGAIKDALYAKVSDKVLDNAGIKKEPSKDQLNTIFGNSKFEQKLDSIAANLANDPNARNSILFNKDEAGNKVFNKEAFEKLCNETADSFSKDLTEPLKKQEEAKKSDPNYKSDLYENLDDSFKRRMLSDKSFRDNAVKEASLNLKASFKDPNNPTKAEMQGFNKNQRASLDKDFKTVMFGAMSEELLSKAGIKDNPDPKEVDNILKGINDPKNKGNIDQQLRTASREFITDPASKASMLFNPAENKKAAQQMTEPFKGTVENIKDKQQEVEFNKLKEDLINKDALQNEEPLENLDENLKMDMLKSKEFREQKINESQQRIKTALEQAPDMSKGGLNALPKDVKNQLNKDVQTVLFGRVSEAVLHQAGIEGTPDPSVMKAMASNKGSITKNVNEFTKKCFEDPAKNMKTIQNNRDLKKASRSIAKMGEKTLINGIKNHEALKNEEPLESFDDNLKTDMLKSKEFRAKKVNEAQERIKSTLEKAPNMSRDGLKQLPKTVRDNLDKDIKTVLYGHMAESMLDQAGVKGSPNQKQLNTMLDKNNGLNKRVDELSQNCLNNPEKNMGTLLNNNKLERIRNTMTKDLSNTTNEVKSQGPSMEKIQEAIKQGKAAGF